MGTAVITGSGGLIGSEAALHFARRGMDVVGIDNDMRSVFFGEAASTSWNIERLKLELGGSYVHHAVDIRDRATLDQLFSSIGESVALVVHAAAQPSHDWAARDPLVDFDINAVGTLNMLEVTRRYAADAVFIFTSTNKVYGDRPNALPLEELDTRWELDRTHPYQDGIPEEMSIDGSLHSIFGASKVGADVLVQEYGRYFGMKTVCFRGGTLTGPMHSATELHGFLAYLVRCALESRTYTIFGYGGKQVRDAIHSSDLIACFDNFFEAPRVAEVYNIGGSRYSHCSVLEAIDLVQDATGRELRHKYDPVSRVGDHIWYVSDNSKFRQHYPQWELTYDVPRIIRDIVDQAGDRWAL